MYQRAAENGNGSFVQAGYTGRGREMPELPDLSDASNGRRQTNNLQDTESGSADAPQNAIRNAFADNGEILSRLKLASLDAGDLLLAAILYFTLHDTGDDDLFWIAAILFLTGKGSGKKTQTDSR